MTLVDLRSDWADFVPFARESREHGHIAPGVYTGLSRLLTFELSGLVKNDHPFDPMFFEGSQTDRDRYWHEYYVYDMPHDFGVCDSALQVIERWPQLVTCDRNLLIDIQVVRRADQPADGGWRWHKWGEYIGTHEIQFEYLYDEVGIEQVELFQLYELSDMAVAR